MSPERPGSELPALLEESAEELYEDAPVGYLSTASDGTILRANRTFLALGGYEADELVGRRRFYDLLPPGAKIYYETHYAPLLEMQQEVRELALEIVRVDGTRVPVLVNARVRGDKASGRSVIRVTVFDASHRRRYEQELLSARADAESRAAAASALEHVSEAVVLLDDDGRVVVLNAAACRLFGITVEDAIGFALEAVVSGWASIEARIPVGRSAEPVPPAVVPLAVEGNTHWVSASGESAPDGVVYTLRDVTTERRLQDFRDDIVAVVSHELRTPLAGVYGAAQTLAALGADLDEEQRQLMIEMIVQQSGRLSRIVEEMLLTQRLDTGDLVVVRESIDVVEVVERVVHASLSWRDSRPVRVIPTGPILASGDPTLFEQVLVNLLDNAIKYTPPGTEVVLDFSAHRGTVRVTVSDEGPGVPHELHERIFERFFRADPGQLSGVTGSGLGLYISRELARRMDGRVGILPGGPGATFYVDLPAA